MSSLPKPLELPGLVAGLTTIVQVLTVRVTTLEAQVAALQAQVETNTGELRRLRERADRGRRSGTPA